MRNEQKKKKNMKEFILQNITKFYKFFNNGCDYVL